MVAEAELLEYGIHNLDSNWLGGLVVRAGTDEVFVMRWTCLPPTDFRRHRTGAGLRVFGSGVACRGR
jgi:hypothetical protein